MVVNIEIQEDNSVTTKITPCIAGKYVVNEATGQDALDILNFIESISVNVEIDDEGNVTEKGKQQNTTEEEQPQDVTENVE